MMTVSKMNEPEELVVRVYDPDWEYMLSVKYSGCDICPKCGMPLENGKCIDCEEDEWTVL